MPRSFSRPVMRNVRPRKMKHITIRQGIATHRGWCIRTSPTPGAGSLFKHMVNRSTRPPGRADRSCILMFKRPLFIRAFIGRGMAPAAWVRASAILTHTPGARRILPRSRPKGIGFSIRSVAHREDLFYQIGASMHFFFYDGVRGPNQALKRDRAGRATFANNFVNKCPDFRPGLR